MLLSYFQNQREPASNYSNQLKRDQGLAQKINRRPRTYNEGTRQHFPKIPHHNRRSAWAEAVFHRDPRTLCYLWFPIISKNRWFASAIAATHCRAHFTRSGILLLEYNISTHKEWYILRFKKYIYEHHIFMLYMQHLMTSVLRQYLYSIIWSTVRIRSTQDVGTLSMRINGLCSLKCWYQSQSWGLPQCMSIKGEDRLLQCTYAQFPKNKSTQ
jgi:hypothetical protein